MKLTDSLLTVIAAFLLSAGFAHGGFSVLDLTVDETAGNAVLTIELQPALGEDAMITWETIPGTALAGVDYTTSSGTETFLAGQNNKNISIPIISDGNGECVEEFTVRLSNPIGTGAFISDAEGRVTIPENEVVTLLFDPGTGALGSDAGAADLDGDGSVDGGLFVYSHPGNQAGSYCFKVVTTSTTFGVWRTILNVTTGEASLHIKSGELPAGTVATHQADTPASEGIILRDFQFTGGETWYLRVDAEPGAQWSLFSGEPFVTDTGPLLDDTEGGYAPLNVTLGPEGTAFFRTQVPGATQAWALWLNGDRRFVGVKKGGLPFPDLASAYDRRQEGQMLLVPSYLGLLADSYFFAVSGNEGDALVIDSHSVPVQPLGYNATRTGVIESASGAPYRVFQVEVPITSLAWDVEVKNILGGNPEIAIRKGEIPSAFVNDVFSEAPGTAEDSVTAVPPTLTNGTWYATVYSEAAFRCDLTNGDPSFSGAVQPIDFLDSLDTPPGPEPNPKPARSGWMYFLADDISQQDGLLGWELTLLNAIAGTEIAIRQNAVPGRMKYRNANAGSGLTFSRSISTQQRVHLDASSTLGFLQRPGQQADVWYVGIYLPDQALGGFDLQRAAIMPPLTPPNGSSLAVVDHLPLTWRYYRFDLQDGFLGWERELLNVTGGGEPRLVTRRALLPDFVSPSSRAGSTTWPNGTTVVHRDDWFDRSFGEEFRASLSATGMPLELVAGSTVTYYVGIFNNSSTEASSYTFRSRVIDDDNAPYLADRLVAPLSFSGAGSSATGAGLPAEEADFYRVTIPPNTRSWRLRVTPTSGDVRLFVRKGHVPEYDSHINGSARDSGGVEMERAGMEVYQLLPLGENEFLEEADYFIAVVAEQGGPADYDLASEGEIPILGPIVPTPAGTVVPYAIPADEIELHRITVPAGLLALELRLDQSAGEMDLSLREDELTPWPSHRFGDYGYDWGNQPDHLGASLLTIQNPPAGTYALTVRANRITGSTPLAAAGNLVVTSHLAQPLAIDGGTATITGQEPSSWRYFEVAVPATGILGWDVRLGNLAGAGEPQLVVSKDRAPSNGVQFAGWPSPSSVPSRHRAWPANATWAQRTDWTNREQASGAGYLFRSFVTAFGAPLDAGTYLVAVHNASGVSPIDYSITSRTIGELGSGANLEVRNLAFSGGAEAIAALDPREAAYFRVTIAPNTRSWKVQAGGTTAADELALVVRHAFIPDLAGNTVSHSTPFDLREGGGGGGALVQKDGTEFYHLFPEDGEEFLDTGDYFLAVVSEGQNPASSVRLGTGAVDGNVTSLGAVPYTSFGPAQPNPEVPLLLSPVLPQSVSLTFHASEVKLMTFEVPAGASSLEVALSDEAGDDVHFTLLPGTLPPQPHPGGSSYSAHYGYDGGTRTASIFNTSLATIPEPQAGPWTLALRSAAPFPSTWHDATTADLRVQVIAPVPLDFCGGSFHFNSDQPPGSWRYYRVEVPALDPNGDPYLAWDIGVSSYTGGNPKLFVRRDELPLSSGVFEIDRAAATWPSGSQAINGTDWTNLSTDQDGTLRDGDRDLFFMGRPLEPGTYFVGVLNESGSVDLNYTIESRCVGLPGSGADLEVADLAFSGGTAAIADLAPRRARFFRVTVPPGTETWRVRLTGTTGESALVIRKDWLPGFITHVGNNADLLGSEGVQMLRDGNEIYTLLPPDNQTEVPPGDYWIAVVGMGTGGTSNRIGPGPVSATLESAGELPVPALGILSHGGMISQPLSLGPSEIQLYRFEVAAGIEVMEIRLENRTGEPGFGVRADELIPMPPASDSYGIDHGSTALVLDDQIAVFVNPAPGTWTVSVRSGKSGGTWANGTADLVIEDVGVRPLAYSAAVAAPPVLASDTAVLLDGQERYYRVEVPSFVVSTDAGTGIEEIIPTLGWKLTLTETTGNATMRIMKDLGASGGFTVTSTRAIVVPPFLVPGSSYQVEVSGSGLTSYTLTSEAIAFENTWSMPQGYNLDFADSGERDLAQDDWVIYAVDVPKGNGGILRTELVALNGDSNLYIREDGIPTTDHRTTGAGGVTLYDRSLTGGGTEYANWVPLTRYETELRPGRWVLGVRAKNSNSRFRLKLSTGDVQDLVLDGGTVVDASVLSDDFRYYRVTVPEDAPVVWNLSFTEDFGDLVLHLRDTVPPGNGPTLSANHLVDAHDDNRNNWPYWSQNNSGFQDPGSYEIITPPLRPGHTWFIGMRGRLDGTYDLDSSTSAETFTAPPGSVPGQTSYGAVSALDFFDGSVTFDLPAGEHRTFRIPVPQGATRFGYQLVRMGGTNVTVRLEQGTVPLLTGTVHHNNPPGGSSSFTRDLSATDGWPWVPGYDYFATLINNGAALESVSLTLSGEGAPTLYQGWAASFGLTGPEAEPNAVNNQQGIENLFAYAFGLSPLAGVPTGAVVDPRWKFFLSDGVPVFPGVEFQIPVEAPGDLCYVVEESQFLDEPWNLLGIRAGTGGWIGGGFIVEEPPFSGYHRVLVFSTGTVGEDRHNFLRLRVFLLGHP